MASASLSPLHRQVARVHRRLLLQTLVNSLIWCWTGAILVCVGWFLLQPHLLSEPLRSSNALRWAVAGGIVGAGTLLAAVLCWLRAPSRLTAALSLDERFGLKERVTTSLTLAPEQETSPAGQALLEDVNQRIKDLHVGSRFPLRVSWTAALVPVCAALLAVVAIFYDPTNSQVTASTPDERNQLPVNATEIDQKMKDLKKKVREKPAVAKIKSQELEELEAELEKIANRPRGTKEEIRERVKEMTALEKTMQQREKEMAERARSLKKQLERLDSLAQKEGEGPAKDLQKALSEGKLDKAREELEKLNKRLQNNELTAKEKEQLKRQLENMKNKLERLAQQKDQQQQLKEANLDPETLQRELKELKKESQKLGDLQDLANQLGQCQKCLKEGDMKGASQSLSQASAKMQSMEGQDEDLQDLRDQLRRLQDAKDSC